MNKNAQVEIAGLLIIVILVTMVLLFALSINIGKIENVGDGQTVIRDKQMRERFGPVLLETSTNCDNRKVRELLLDCAYRGGSIECSSGKTSCDEAESVIKGIVSTTLEPYYIFELEITKENGGQLPTQIKIEGGCEDPKIKDRQPAHTNIGSVYGSLQLTLTQCY